MARAPVAAPATIPAEDGGEHAPPAALDRWRRADIAGVTALALGLRLFGLNAQLWSDEIAALLFSFRKSFGAIVTQPATFVSHPLYEILAHASILGFGEQPWTARLPAAAFGVASVPVLYLVVRRIASRGEALLGAGLMAVSYHHIFFSQNARGYTVMVFFLLAATLVLLGMRGGLSRRSRIGYVLAAALGAFTIPFGVAIPAGHALIAVPAAIVWRRRKRRRAESPRATAALFAVVIGLVGLAYLPLAAHTIRFATTTGRDIESGATVSGAVIRELIDGLRAGVGGTAGLLAVCAVAAIGVASLARRNRLALGLLAAPVAVTLVVLAILGVGVHPRYLMIGLPLGVVVAARGLSVIASVAGAALRGRGIRLPAAAGAVALVLTLGAAAAPLPRYYGTPKMDFVGALRVVDGRARPSDRVVGASVAGHVIRDFYRPGFPTIETLDDLEREEAAPSRLWVVTTLERILAAHDAAMLDRLRTSYALIGVLPATVEDGQMRIYAEPVR
jgi:4-amino-4-deoxy-L-arabinose transferase-like glycosyltransferase